jgi:hypothetical protein
MLEYLLEVGFGHRSLIGQTILCMQILNLDAFEFYPTETLSEL